MKQNVMNDLRVLNQHQWLREDTLLIGRINNFSGDKNQKNINFQRLCQFQTQRNIQEDKIIQKYYLIPSKGTCKSILFSFNSSIIKIVKHYHTKTHHFSPRIAQMSELSIFLDQLRYLGIQYLNQCNDIGIFLSKILMHCRNRFQKELFRFNYQLTQQQWIKNNRYLDILKKINLDVAFNYFQKTTKIITDQREKSKYQHNKDLLDLHQNAMEFNLQKIRMEGICDFILNKVSRMLKDLTTKNCQNKKAIDSYLKQYSFNLKILPRITKPRNSLYRIQPKSNQHQHQHSKTVRPFSQSNQNRQRPLRQTLMQINVDQVMQKNLIRITKRLPMLHARSPNNFHQLYLINS